MNKTLLNVFNQPHLQKPKQPKQIGDFIIGKTLGEGTFGKVRLGTHKHTQQKVAIKILQKKKIVQVADVQRVTRQIHILKLIRHPNLVQLYQIIQTSKQLMLVMQYMENGQLFDYIVKNKRIKQDEAKRLFHQLIDGIQYVKKINVAHRDLKPQNVLLTYNGSLKIVDFGLSNTYKKGELLKTPCGSPCYAAPEMIQGEKYQGIKVDIWSSGIILFAMLNGYLPFEDQDTNTLYKKVLAGDYSFHHSVSEQARDLIQKILNNNPSQRYTIDQIRQHPWMAKLKDRKSHSGIIVGYNKIPVDHEILKQLTKYGFNDLGYIQTCIQANRHNQATVTYHLAMKKFLKDGGVSKYDIGNDDFDKAMIEPVKRKDNTTELLIDNFFTKNSCAGSTDITQQHNDKRKPRLSKEKDDNKENVSIYMNKKRSKERQRKSKSKQKSKDDIKLVIKEEKINSSQIMMNSVNRPRTSKMSQSVEKKSQGQIKKLKLGSSTTNMDRKTKPSKLDGSVNYGRITITKSTEKNSGRESEPNSASNQRESMIQNRVTRKYKQQFNQSLISKSKVKLKTHTQRQKQRSRINSSVNQSVNQCQITYQGLNTTTISNNYSGHVLMNLSKKYKQNENSVGYIDQYLTKGKKQIQKKHNPSSSTKQPINESSKVIKARRL